MTWSLTGGPASGGATYQSPRPSDFTSEDPNPRWRSPVSAVVRPPIAAIRPPLDTALRSPPIIAVRHPTAITFNDRPFPAVAASPLSSYHRAPPSWPADPTSAVVPYAAAYPRRRRTPYAIPPPLSCAIWRRSPLPPSSSSHQQRRNRLRYPPPSQWGGVAYSWRRLARAFSPDPAASPLASTRSGGGGRQKERGRTPLRAATGVRHRGQRQRRRPSWRCQPVS